MGQGLRQGLWEKGKRWERIEGDRSGEKELST